jgi:hypothetical protein
MLRNGGRHEIILPLAKGNRGGRVNAMEHREWVCRQDLHINPQPIHMLEAQCHVDENGSRIRQWLELVFSDTKVIDPLRINPCLRAVLTSCTIEGLKDNVGVHINDG